MTNEQSFFLQILQDHCLNRKTTCPDGLDWEVLLRLASSHQVEGVLYMQCREYLAGQPELGLFAQRLNECYAANIFYYANRKTLEAEIGKAFAENGIAYFVIKGSEIAAVYPVPALRTMGDSDYVVHPEDKEKANRILMDLGYESHPTPDLEWCYYKQNMKIELHDHLVYKQATSTIALEQYFAAYWDHVRQEGGRNRLDWSYHFLFLIHHLRKHILYSGVGFRQFMDIAILTQKCPELNWPWIQEELEKLDLLRFTQATFSLCAAWFGIPSPISCEELSDEFVQEATGKIFQDGVFGNDNEKNKTNSIINEIRATKMRRMTVVRRVFRNIFPSYSSMKDVEHYAFLRGRPYLLPFAWIYRICYGFTYGKQKAQTDRLTDSFVSAEEVAQRSKMLEQWGL